MKRYMWMILPLLVPAGLAAQDNGAQSAAERATTTVPFKVEPVPFGPGETLQFRARWGIFGTVGEGSLRVESVDTVRGHPAYKLAFYMKARVTFFSMDDVQRSWLDVDELYAHRFQQKLNQSTYKRDRTLDFLRDEMRWVRQDKPEDNGALATDVPLDDISFLYFVRTLPLQVGETYTLPRYYKDDGNPVTLKVLRKEKISLPAGEFQTIVVQPIIKTDSGLFKEDAKGEVWFTDDARRLLVKLQAKMGAGPFGGTLKMELEKYTPGTKLVSAASVQPLRAWH